MSGPVPRTRRVGSEPRPTPKPGLVVVPVDGETVVYDPDSDVLHRLDGPASAVWSRLDGNTPVQALASQIAAEFDAPEETVRRDVAALTGTLWERGLLDGSPVAEPAPPVPDEGVGRLPASTVLPPASTLYSVGRYRALEHAFEVATSDAAVRDYLAEVLADLAAPGGAAATSRYELVERPPGVVRGR